MCTMPSVATRRSDTRAPLCLNRSTPGRGQFNRFYLSTPRGALHPMKGHLFFNTWCAATMLAELLENVDTDTDIIIVDRGLFDALVWLTLQHQRRELTQDEAKTIEAFLLLDR